MSTAVPPGNCVTHGWHGRAVCPRCSTSTLPAAPIAQSSQSPFTSIQVTLERARGYAPAVRWSNEIEAALAALVSLTEERKQLEARVVELEGERDWMEDERAEAQRDVTVIGEERDSLAARLVQAEEALIRCAELAGVDGEAIEAARSGALVCPPLSDFAVEAVAQLRRDYDEGKP